MMYVRAVRAQIYTQQSCKGNGGSGEFNFNISSSSSYSLCKRNWETHRHPKWTNLCRSLSRKGHWKRVWRQSFLRWQLCPLSSNPNFPVKNSHDSQCCEACYFLVSRDFLADKYCIYINIYINIFIIKLLLFVS